MYPFIRLAWQFFKHRNDPKLTPTDVHQSRHYCLPQDIDLWWELNNGRTLTMYDMGRLPMAMRVGLVKTLRQNKWGLTMAGCSVRYRRRIRMFEAFTMKSRAVGWDDKFIYLEQSIWKKSGECAGHILYRSAVTGRSGIIPPQDVMAALGLDLNTNPLPDWVKAWIDADKERPWPPMAAGE